MPTTEFLQRYLLNKLQPYLAQGCRYEPARAEEGRLSTPTFGMYSTLLVLLPCNRDDRLIGWSLSSGGGGCNRQSSLSILRENKGCVSEEDVRRWSRGHLAFRRKPAAPRLAENETELFNIKRSVNASLFEKI